MLTQSSPRVIESLPNITKPSLVLVGADDTPFLAAADYMAKKIPNAEKLVIPNAGHVSNIDQPDLFNDGVLEFLNTLSVVRGA
jgi:pimeloyl-ACP methyl ester carboxylesterase